MSTGNIVALVWAVIIGFFLIAWIISLRQKIKRAEQFRQGVEALLENGVIVGIDRARHQKNDDGFVISFTGPHGSYGPHHEVSVTTTKSGRDNWQYSSVATAT